MAHIQFDFKYLKNNIPIEYVLEKKGLLPSFKRCRDKFIGPCPIHGGDNTRAFVATISKNLWFCFTKCNAGGDVIELVRRLERLNYRQTAEYLASISYVLPGRYEEKCSALSVQVQVQKNFQPFIKPVHLIADALLLKQKAIRPDTARKFEAGAYYGAGFLQGCVAVRLHDHLSNPLGYAGRRIQPNLVKSLGKWKFPKGLPKSKLLYNYHRIRHMLKKGIVLVECPWAVMRLSQIGIPAVALLGTYLSQTQRKLLSNASRVIIMLDGDPAGKKAAMRIKDILQSYTCVSIAALPSGLDPDDLSDHQLTAKIQHLLA